MEYEFVEADLLEKMFVSGANNLENNKDIVDRLNVFPVPDGDTGTNMSLTMNAAVQSLADLKQNDISSIGRAVSKGSLMGARGNSGVILSQILRGFSNSIEGQKALDVFDFAKAFKKAAQMAYKAVIKPIEGTILTVARETGEYALELAKEEKTIEIFFEKLVGRARESLDNTPNLLKELRDAGVVDSGGKGLVLIYEGMHRAVAGEPVEKKKMVLGQPRDTYEVEEGIKDIKYIYCIEFILESKTSSCEEIKSELEDMGDSMVVVQDAGLIKVHVHTNEPGKVIQTALERGEIIKTKIENMKAQRDMQTDAVVESERQADDSDKYCVIAVASGKGFASIFKDLGADFVIEGGQTMNPSTREFVDAINKSSAENIIILPNNKNIIMAANQAKEISSKNVIVIPTHNIPQALSAMVAFNPDKEASENEKSMIESMEYVDVGQVTFAIRNTSLNGKEIKEGDIIGIVKGGIKVFSKDIPDAALKTAKSLIDEESEIVSIFYGEGISEKEAEQLANELKKDYEEIEFEIYYGGQPVYYYIISAE